MLEEQIKEIAQLRETVDKLKKWKSEAMMAWEKEHEKQLSDIVIEAAKLAEAETKLREQAVELFKTTGNKQVADGVGIRETEKLEYDEKQAFEWAKEHVMALSLDKKAFDKIAKASPMEFVKVVSVPTAAIATDLSKYLINVEVPF